MRVFDKEIILLDSLDMESYHDRDNTLFENLDYDVLIEKALNVLRDVHVDTEVPRYLLLFFSHLICLFHYFI